MGNVSISANKEFIIIIIIIMHWKLPNMTHYNLLPTRNGSLTINTAFQKRCAKFIYSCLNSDYLIIKSTSISHLFHILESTIDILLLIGLNEGF